MSTRSHQNDSTGVRDESLPLWMTVFRDYLDFAAENPSARVIQQRAAHRREVVTRSLIGHQPGLSTRTNEEPLILPTTVPTDRARGPNTVANNVNIVTNNVTEAGSVNNEDNNTTNETVGSPRRRAPTNEGRSTRPRRANVDFGLSTNPFLPPSTGQWQPFDLNRMESSYLAIASSINNLATHQLVRRTMDIHKDIIATLQQKNMSVSNGCDSAMVRALDEQLRDLDEELKVSRRFHRKLLKELSDEESDTNEVNNN